MTEPSVAAVAPGMLRVLRADGCTVGAAFLVAERIALSCAHVVLAAGGGPGMTVSIRYYALDGRANACSSVTVDPECWRPYEAGDIALLHLTESAPDGVRPLPIGTGVASGHDVRTIGFPVTGTTTSLNGAGEILGMVNDNGYPRIDMTMSQATPGFSGAPVYDQQQGVVVGIITTIIGPDQNQRHPYVTLAIPLEEVIRVCPALTPADVCPYRNLDVFEEEHTRLFFGRNAQTNELLKRLRDEPRFLAVLGASGSGKSSLVRAGLLPRLRSGAIAGSDRWSPIIIRPGDDPWTELSHRGVGLAERNDLRLALPAFLANRPTDDRLVLVIDQFEELFSRCKSDTCDAFLHALTDVVISGAPVSVIAVMRNDYYASFAEFADRLIAAFPGSICNVDPTIARPEIEAMIVGPAAAAGLTVDRSLVTVLVEETLALAPPRLRERGAVDSSVLPLLESALDAAWRRRTGTLIPIDAYPDGGVTGTLSRWASDAYRSLREDVQPLARRVLLELVDVIVLGNERRVARRRRRRHDLVHDPAQAHDIGEIVDALTAARLLVSGGEGQDRFVELIHETLIERWRLFSEWLQTDSAFVNWRSDVERDAERWRASGRSDHGALLAGRRLAEASTWVRERAADLDAALVEYVGASEAAGDELRQQRRRAEAADLLARAQRLPPDRWDARLALGQRSYTTWPSVEVYLSLYWSLMQHPRLVRRTPIDAVSEPARSERGQSRGRPILAFSEDGRRLAIRAQDAIDILDTESGSTIARLALRPGLQSLVVSTLGAVVGLNTPWEFTLARVRDGTIVFVHEKETPFSPDEPVTFSRGDRYVGYRVGDTVAIVELSTGKVVRRVAAPGDFAFTTDERSLLFTASPASLDGPTGLVSSAATAVRRMEIISGAVETVFSAPAVETMFSALGPAWMMLTPNHLFVEAGTQVHDPHLHVWTADGRERLLDVPIPSPIVSPLVWSTLAEGAASFAILVQQHGTLLYDGVARNAQWLNLPPSSKIFSSDERWLLAGEFLYDLRTNTCPCAIPSDRGNRLRRSEMLGRAFVAGSDDLCVVSRGVDESDLAVWLERWDRASFARVRVVGVPRLCYDFAVSADGRWLAIQEFDAIVAYATDDGVEAFRLPMPQMVNPAKGWYEQVVKAPDLRFAFTGDSALLLVQTGRARPLESFDVARGFRRTADYPDMELEAGGSNVAGRWIWSLDSGAYRGLRILDLSSGLEDVYPSPEITEINPGLGNQFALTVDSAGLPHVALVMGLAYAFDSATRSWRALPVAEPLLSCVALPSSLGAAFVGLTQSKTLCVVDFRSGTFVRTFGVIANDEEYLDPCAHLYVSPAGSSVLICGVDRERSLGMGGVFVSLDDGRRLGELWSPIGASAVARASSRFVAFAARQQTSYRSIAGPMQILPVVYPEELADLSAAIINRADELQFEPDG
jgi:hypothetical protein